MPIGKEVISEWFKGLQDRICSGLEEADGKGVFKEDQWDRVQGGGGRTRIIQNGNVIEKGGVNFSAVFGKAPEFLINQLKADENAQFFATGVSIVIHPSNPHVPIIHMNVRYFEMSGGIAWFGGGIDLTPHYVKQKDGEFFHQQLKVACDKHDLEYYPEFKKWADNYFFIKHRQETRGIGGIFFDQLKSSEKYSLEDRWKFVQEIGDSFLPIYTELMKRNRSSVFTDNEKQWQLLRRGRYVEFNLVYDRGTKFGLETDGRTESILMSLPNLAAWEYNFKVELDSPEQQTLGQLKKGIDWVK
ncbi:MAG: oxygen-dependent coproporphyrinogen oxidase [Bacteroidetes bacterium]|nr:oxygen-dependent coproporphyrinogen oxidase [Bacteroidota bacterium]MBK7430189.1 oxygen-dependent coproporphyrinogen oxidase [Bacteroidota bacterium]MBK7572419.1 oxygen-dependent coproporphyrinogen oxidase [Bacteroidota bacterium]MBP9790980.1 oxygen-dependent coproporphyrinogen oxidase [Bacteroidia bacterium]